MTGLSKICELYDFEEEILEPNTKPVVSDTIALERF
jgi:hypothetical protein